MRWLRNSTFLTGRWARSLLTGYTPPTAPTAGSLADVVRQTNALMASASVTSGFSGSALSYALAPASNALPTGTSLSTAGLITGTPTDPIGTTAITVRATNGGGFADVTFDFIIADIPDQMVAPVITPTSTSISVDYDNTTADNNSTITSVDLSYRLGAGAWTEVLGITDPEVISGLAPSSGYGVRTRANNAFGPGPWSAEVTTTTLATGAEVETSFGDNTPAGAGGVDVTGTVINSGDANGHWQIASGRISPSAAGEAANLNAGPYSLVLNNAQTVNIAITPNGRHIRTLAELDTALAAVPLDGSITVYGRARDYRSEVTNRYQPVARTRTGIQTVQFEGYTQDADALHPKKDTWTALLPAIRFSGDTKLEFRRFSAFATYSQVSGDSLGLHVVRIEDDCVDCGVYSCEIASTSFVTLINDGTDETDHSFAVNGGQTDSYLSGGVAMRGTGSRVNRAYVHDVSRGFFFGATSSALRTSRASNFNIEDTYSNFFTFGSGTSGSFFEVYDFVCMHVWGDVNDAFDPHSSTGMSGDPTGGETLDGFKIQRGICHVGNKRHHIHVANSWPAMSSASTGAKTNDPNPSDASYAGNGQDTYANHVTRAVTQVSGGQSLMIAGCSGGYDAAHVNVWSYNDIPINMGAASVYIDAVENARLAHITGSAITNGGEFNGDPGYVSTEDTSQGYAMYDIAWTGENNGRDQMVGPPVGFDWTDLQLEHIWDAYTPAIGSKLYTMGNMGHASPLYSANGVTSFSFAHPSPTGGTPTRLNSVTLDGTDRAASGNVNGTGIPSSTTKVRGLFAIKPHADIASTTTMLFDLQGNTLHVRRLSSGALEIYIKDPGDTTQEEKINSGPTGLMPADAWSYVAWCYDADTGYVSVAVNGQRCEFAVADTNGSGPLVAAKALGYFGSREGGTPTEIFKGDVEVFGLEFGAVWDLDTVAGMNELYASDGTFRDLSAVEATAHLWLAGTIGTDWGDQTGLNAWTASAAVANTAAPDTTAPILSAPIASQTGETTANFSVTSDEAGGFIYAAIRLATDPVLPKTDIENWTGDAVDATLDATPTADGSNAGSFTGLTAGTDYIVDIFQRDAAGNESAVVSSGTITTLAAAAGIALDSSTARDISAINEAVGSDNRGAEMVIAFDNLKRTAAGNCWVLSHTSNDTRIALWGDGRMFVAIEDHTGNPIGTANFDVLGATDWLVGEERSVLVVVQDGNYEVWVDGTKVIDETPAFATTIKLPYLLNAASNDVNTPHNGFEMQSLFMSDDPGIVQALLDDANGTWRGAFDAGGARLWTDGGALAGYTGMAIESAAEIQSEPGTGTVTTPA